MVKDCLTLYGKSNKALHLTASGCIYHALQYGNTTPLNTFFKGLEEHRINDANSLRAYIGFVCSTPMGEDGKASNLFVYSQKEGFSLNKKHGENMRKSLTLEDFLSTEPFYAHNIRAEGKTIGLAELLSMMKKAVEKADKQGTELNITIPFHILEAGKELVKAIDSTDVEAIEAGKKRGLDDRFDAEGNPKF
jgi:hypothetical protein